jgi:Tol biopolymer transport system component
MKYRGTLVALFVVMLTVAVSGQTNKAEILLGTGLHQEDVELNCTEAIKTYQKVLQEKNAPKPIAAQAQLRIASCQEKLGLREARASYELVLSRYPDQAELVAAARVRLANLSAGQQAGLRVERVGTEGTIDVLGRPFPDGRYFAYTGENLPVRDLKTGETRRVMRSTTPDGNIAENPVPSPDGKQIAFLIGPTIRVINSDGTNNRVLLRDTGLYYIHAWSPDKRYIAAVHSSSDNTHTIILISTGDSSTKRLKTTGTNYPQVGGFSPDGRFLVYPLSKRPNDTTGGVFLLATDGNLESILVRASEQGPTNFTYAGWSPDGRRVIFISDRSGRRALESIRVVDGRPEGPPEELSVGVFGPGQFPMGFTQDGSFFYGQREIRVEAYTAEFDPVAMKVLSPTPITDRAVGNNLGPEMSPDGASVAFIRRREGMPSAVMVRPLASGGEERVVGTINGTGTYGARALQWFPDGRSLLVTDGVNPRRKRFRRIDVISGEEKMVLDAPWEVWTGAVSADGKHLFYSTRESNQVDTVRLVKRNLETSDEKEIYQVETDGVGLFGLVASPDGASLAFSCNIENGQRALFVLPTEGGIPRELYRTKYEDGTWPMEMRWTSDSRTVVVVGAASAGHALYAIPAAGGSLKSLGLTMEEILTPLISPDGRRIVFGGRTGSEELWVIRNLLPDAAKTR